jgi:hypothetical protein
MIEHMITHITTHDGYMIIKRHVASTNNLA